MSETTTKWPKVLRELTPKEQAIHDDFMRRWHEVLPGRYGVVERFNHSFPVRRSRSGFRATIEIGAGLGEHLSHERLTAEQERDYVAVELRQNMADRLPELTPVSRRSLETARRGFPSTTGPSIVISPSTSSSICQTSQPA